MKQTIFNGQRAKVYIQTGGDQGQKKLIGLFTNVSGSLGYSVQEAYILGRSSVAEFVYTGMEPVRLSLSGFRVINSGPFAIQTVPKLQEILQYEGITVEVEDRTTGLTALKVFDCFIERFSFGFGARSISNIEVSMVGSTYGDESADFAEAPGATKIDDGSNSSNG